MVERLDLAAQPEVRDSGDRSVNEIRRKIAMERETIKDTVDKLSGRLQQSLDWREYVAAHPGAGPGSRRGHRPFARRNLQAGAVASRTHQGRCGRSVGRY